ncbi:hypothetical protein FBUS_09455 [Fasciolopsis buskii]|uniref:Uncharacterized protein n=1 Tax=Fasciolopsis buskii TaxID=27845 RepID=A0A8E0VN32_9TREM|nr:hypothetical protein FBUS_09455 [Fasciolopsis buski]
MYDRAERKFTFQTNTGTSTHVGPGSYEINDIVCNKYDIGYAPFDSLDERKFQFTADDATKVPPPWSYKPEAYSHKIKGCSSLSNTAPRFQSHRSEGPGPNAYFIGSTWGGRKPDPCSLYVPDVLIKAAQNQNGPEPKYALTSKRPPLNPPTHKVGPGQYDGDTNHWEKLAYSARERNMIQAIHPLNVPRFIEQIIHEVEKQKFPGPATYSVIDSVSPGISKRGPNGEVIQSAPFNVEAERFKTPKSEVPAPNVYNPGSPVYIRRSASALDKSAFNTSAERFHEHPHSSPG